ncbi:MAG: hypothetical protein ACOCTN_05875 [Candidatus Natronoplasma sp.]
MVDPSSLTYKQKILLYLKDYSQITEKVEKPEDVTQKGISQNVGISRTHVSRILGEMVEEDFVNEDVSSVKGHDRKLKTYRLTSRGIKAAEELLDDLSNISITLIKGDEEKNLPLTAVEEETEDNLDILTCLFLLESSEDLSIDLIEHGVLEPVTMDEEVPDVDEIYQREDELDNMKRWLEGDEPILAVLSRKGRGASSLTSKFVESLEERHLLWINLKGTTEKKIKRKISSFLDRIGISGDSWDKLRSQRALVIFDDYYEVDEDVVSSFRDLLSEIERSDPLKVIFTGRVGTPVYERFYQPKHVERGLVRELEVPPLDKEGAQKILGNKIKEGALKRIMMFTKGSPLLLKLLREDEKEKLIELTPWEEEQISLLMYLKTETEEKSD